MDYHYQLVNNLDSFKTFTLKLSEESWYKSLDCGRRYTLDLVLEELLSNTIKYGYDDALPHTIAITFAVGSDHLKLTVADDGHEFDPRGDYGADVTKPLQERKLSTLSGGERQRAWIAMTLAQEPGVLLLDEPTTFLDIRCQFEVIELVRDLNRRCGITVLMVLHDLNLAARCSDFIVTLKGRRIRHIGTPREILQPEILREIFEIESVVHVGADDIPYCVPTGSVKEEDNKNGDGGL